MFEVLFVAHALLQALRMGSSRRPHSELQDFRIPAGFAEDVRTCRQSSVYQEPRVQSLAFDVLIEVEKIQSILRMAQQLSGHANADQTRRKATEQSPSTVDSDMNARPASDEDDALPDQENLHVQRKHTSRPQVPPCNAFVARSMAETQQQKTKL